MGQGGILGTTQLGARLGEYCQWGERCPPTHTASLGLPITGGEKEAI